MTAFIDKRLKHYGGWGVGGQGADVFYHVCIFYKTSVTQPSRGTLKIDLFAVRVIDLKTSALCNYLISLKKSLGNTEPLGCKFNPDL